MSLSTTETKKSWLSNGTIQRNLRLQMAKPQTHGSKESRRELTTADVGEIVTLCDNALRTTQKIP